MTRRNVSRDGPDPIDVHVGGRIRLRRTMIGMSQEQVGKALGVSFQQLNKREHGTNRCSASALCHTARVLDVPVSFFFDDMPKHLREAKEVAPEAAYHGHRRDRAALELMRHFHALDTDLRKTILDLARHLDEFTTTRVTGSMPGVTEDEVREYLRASAN